MDLKEKIRNAQDVKSEIVQIDDWDCAVEIVTMKGSARSRLYEFCTDKDGNVIQERFDAGVIVECAHDPETHEKLFTYDDIDWLLEKSAGPIARLGTVAMRLSGLSANAVKDAEKNSNSVIPKDDSTLN